MLCCLWPSDLVDRYCSRHSWSNHRARLSSASNQQSNPLVGRLQSARFVEGATRAHLLAILAVGMCQRARRAARHEAHDERTWPVHLLGASREGECFLQRELHGHLPAENVLHVPAQYVSGRRRKVLRHGQRAHGHHRVVDSQSIEHDARVGQSARQDLQ